MGAAVGTAIAYAGTDAFPLEAKGHSPTADLFYSCGHDECADRLKHGGTAMAEIRVAPQRRNKAIVWVLLVVVVIAALAAWYFLAGPGQAATGV